MASLILYCIFGEGELIIGTHPLDPVQSFIFIVYILSVTVASVLGISAKRGTCQGKTPNVAWIVVKLTPCAIATLCSGHTALYVSSHP